VSIHSDINLIGKTTLSELYHIVDGAAYVWTLDSMLYHLAMERNITTPVFVWWGNIPPKLRAYPGSIDYWVGNCNLCIEQGSFHVPRNCLSGNYSCLRLDKHLMLRCLLDLTSKYPSYLNAGNAMKFIQDIALEYCKGIGLDIGAGQFPLPGAIPIDQNMYNNAYCLSSFPDSSVDYVFSSHCLEHLQHWDRAIVEWIRVLKPGGILFLYLPHESMEMWHPGSSWVGDEHKWIPTWRVISDFMLNMRMVIVGCNPLPDRAYGFWVAFKKIKCD
jgi:SAM-dependent methyltransferase